MGKDKDYIKISEFKSDALKRLALQYNTTKEKKTIGIKFKGERLDLSEISAFVKDEEFDKLKAELANENNNIQRLLGYTPEEEDPESAIIKQIEEQNEKLENITSTENTEQQTVEQENNTPTGNTEQQTVENARAQIETQRVTEVKNSVKKDYETKTSSAKINTKQKANSVEEAYKEVRAIYENIRGYDPKTGKTNGIQSKDAYKAVKKAYEDKGNIYKEALKQLKYDYKHGDARIAASNAIRAAKATDAYGNIVDLSKIDIDTSEEVKEYAIEYLKAQNNGVLDKREYRALKGNDKNMVSRAVDWIGGNDSHQKKLRKGVAADNSAAKTRIFERYSIDDMKDAIGNTCPFLQQNVTANGFKNVTILEAAGLIQEEKDHKGKGTGKYNIYKLSMLVRNAIGSDATLNDHDDEAMRETQSLRTDLGQAFERAGVSNFIDVSKLTNRDLRQLVEFCNYYSDRAHNIIVQTYQGIGIGAVTGAATGSSSIKSTSHTEQEIEGTFKVGTSFASDFEKQLKKNIKIGDGATLTTKIVNGGASVYFKVSQIADSDHFIGLAKTVLTAEMLGTLIGGVIGGATALTHALLTHKQENATFDPTKLSRFETYEEALAFVDSQKDMSPEQKRTLRVLLLQGVELVKDEHGIEKAKTIEVVNPVTGIKEHKIAWNLKCCNELNNLLRIGGNGIPNPRELELSVPKVGSKEKDVVKNNYDKTQTQAQTQTFNNSGRVTEDNLPIETPFTAQERITEYSGETTRGVRWDRLAQQYEFLNKYVKKASHRIRMMKVMQGVNNNDYTLENLKKLTELSFKVSANLEKLRSPNKRVQNAELLRIRRELENTFKDVRGFNIVEYMKAFTGDIIGEQKVPEIIINDKTKCVRNKQIKDIVDKSGSGGNSIRSGMANDKTKELDVRVGSNVRTFKDGQQQEAKDYIISTDASGKTPFDRKNSKINRYFGKNPIDFDHKKN